MTVPRSLDELRTVVAGLVEEEPGDVADDANLFELGLDSIELMTLVGTWRQAGLGVGFADLAQRPTLAGWTALLLDDAPAPAPGDDVGSPASDAGDDASLTTADDGTFPLAVMQHAYWVGRAEGQPLGGVAAHLYTEFDGSGVAPERLGRALDALVARHAMLRVRVGEDSRQRVDPAGGRRGLTVHDLTGHAPDEADAALEEIRDRRSHQMLDIGAGEVFSTDLSLLPGGRTRLHVDVDMIAADAVSYRRLLADLARLYAEPETPLPALTTTYRDYLAARARTRGPDTEAAGAHWAERVPDLPGGPVLPRRPARADGDRRRVTRRGVTLAPDRLAALADAARARGVTPAALLATVFAQVVGAWSEKPRFLLNVPLFDRAVPPGAAMDDLDAVVGDFSSSVLVDVDLGEDLGLAERARRLQARLHADTAHAAYSRVHVLRDLSRHHGRQILAPAVFTSALNLGELFDARVRACFGDPVWIVSQGPQVLLDAQVTELDGGLLVNWDLREQEFPDGVVDAMFGAFAATVGALADGTHDDAAPLVPAATLEQRERLNSTPAPAPRRLHDAFFALAAARPDASAVIHAGAVTTYGALAGAALRVAGALRARGVAPGDPVGITLPKGPDQVTAVLGVLAAGGVYVPIGADQPAARAERIRAGAGVAVVLTAGTLAEALDADPADAPVPGTPEDLAYVLFTSGSTGEPKGVEVPHRAAAATVDDVVTRFGIGPGDRTLALSALEFDLSVFDLMAPLSVGGAVVAVDHAAAADPRAWAASIRDDAVTVLNAVPAFLDMILASEADLGDTLRLVLLGGDRVGLDLPGRLAAAAPGARFAGLGGTTETAIHSTVCEVDPAAVPADWTCVPYGTPLSGVALRVVDAAGHDRPDWVAGELWIGGAGVSRGYRGDPERTADRFVEHAGRRWYRTGDLARYRPDGTVEFLSRDDGQVQLRGFRIELGEVESALRADPAVDAAAVTMVGEAAPALVAGVVAANGALDPAVVRERVRASLPAYMVPERVHALPALPLTGNGKVDRGAVADLDRRARDGNGTGTAPSSPLERALVRIWATALDRADLGVDQELYALGGDSVLATRIVTRAREDLDAPEVTVRMLLAAPSVAGLAAAMRARESTPGRLDRAAELYEEVAALSPDEIERELAAGER